MNHHRHTIAGFLLALTLAGTSFAVEEPGSIKASLITVEGVVSKIGSEVMEGELRVVTASLVSSDATKQFTEILLAPQTALDEIGFSVQVGDRLKVRLLSSGPGSSRAHKVLNISRNTMVRLRSVRGEPFWDNHGTWRGGPCRSRSGASGQPGRHRSAGRGR